MLDNNIGTLGVAVWPSYVGICVGDPGEGPHARWEPISADYKRGQITWGMENNEVIGRAEILAPAGQFTHLAYFSGPEGACMVGKVQLPHPILFPTAGHIDVYPIRNADLKLNERQGIDYT
jgi:hypothetical protein